MKTFIPALAMVGVLFGSSAWSHGTMAPGYGGQITEVGDFRVEFAVRDGSVRAWVRDHDDKPVAASGKLVLMAGARKFDAALIADGASLTATVPVKAADKVTTVLSLTVQGKPVSARFAQEAVALPALSGPAKAGEKVFSSTCATCHGMALRGSDAGPPLLHAYYAPGAGHGDDVILAAIAQGAKSHHWKFGDMPKPDGIGAGQDKELLAYIRAMQGANGLGTGTPPAGSSDPHAGHH